MKAMKMNATQRKELKYGLIFLSPWIFGFVVFMAYPIFFSLYMSFHKVITSGSGFGFEFVGFKNYMHTLTINLDFTFAVIDYIKSLFIQVPLIVVMSLVIAMLLNQPVKFRGFYRTLYFLPVIIMSGPVVTVLEKYDIFASFNLSEIGIMRWLEASNLGIIQDITMSLVSNIALILWYSGVQILIFLSSLQKNNKDVYEAARIDGASTWQIFWKITLPGLSDVIVINFIYTIVLLTTLVENPVTLMIRQHMFNKNYGFGYASAQGWIYTVVTLGLLGTYMIVMKIIGKKGD